MEAIVVDKSDTNEPTRAETFWTCKLDTFAPNSLKVTDFF